MKRGVFVVLAIAALLIPGMATAQNLPQGLYIEGRAGVSFPTNLDVVDDPAGLIAAGGSTHFEPDSAPDYVLAGAVGYASRSGWRVELEGSYREHDYENLFIEGGGLSSKFEVDFEGKIWTGMLNAYFDFDPSLYGAEGFPFVPFVGAGIGGMRFEFDPGDQDVAFAFQFIGGVSFHLTPFTAISVSYNFLSSHDIKDDGFTYKYESHNAMAGFRFTF